MEAFPLQISVTAPGIYGSAIDNATGSLASSAKAGQVLLLFMTGEGDVKPTLATGATPLAGTSTANLRGPPEFLPAWRERPSWIITVPANAPPGQQQVVVTVGGVAAPGVPLTITQ